MAKRLSKEEAINRVIDKINLLKDAESADIEMYMNRYVILRDLEGQAREDAYQDIAFALFGDYRKDSTGVTETETTKAFQVA